MKQEIMRKIQASRDAGFTDEQIFPYLEKAYPEQVKASFENGFSQKDIMAFFGGESEEEKTWGDTASKVAENFLPSLGQAAKDFVEPILHPLDTLSGVKNVALGYGEKLNRMVQEGSGQYEEGELAPGEHEKYADAMNDHFAGRYGDLGKIRKTLENDPAGLLLDVGSLAALGSGAVARGAKAGSLASKAGKALEVTGKVLDPATLPIMAAKKTGGVIKNKTAPLYGDLVETFKPATPEQRYAALLKPSSSIDPEQLQRIVEIGLKNKITPTMEGWDNFKGLQEEVGKELGDTLRSLSNPELGPAPMIDMRPIIQKASDTVKGNLKFDVEGQSMMDTVDKLASQADEMFDSPVDMVTADSIKRRQQAGAKATYERDGIHPVAKEFKAALASEIRKEMAKKYPKIAELNKKLEDYHVLEDALAASVNNNFKRDTLGGAAGNMGLGVLTGGQAGGIPGAVAGLAAGKLLKDPAYRARKIFAAYDKKNAPKKPPSKTMKVLGKGARTIWDMLPDAASARALQYQAGRANGLLDLLEED